MLLREYRTDLRVLQISLESRKCGLDRLRLWTYPLRMGSLSARGGDGRILYSAPVGEVCGLWCKAGS